ncbi:low-density lipoprotein receptor class A domain-containing protein 3-like [Engraulis encrasicolus]|uniref:low-density lipoprotein receptor class A domain-containing protein 3-like n=1 Tax=Engraulis encrasicolus TaxID=184585 RepID=UPI002FD0B2CC
MWIWYILLTSGPGPSLVGSQAVYGNSSSGGGSSNISSRVCSAPSNFTCADGQCVPVTARCDGLPDCYDQSDEKGCTTLHSKCSPTFFACANGVHCIIGRFHCNGLPDCPDGSDELDCIDNQELCASASRFHCDNGHCVHRSFLCNGEDNCRDNSDEENCEVTTEYPPHCVYPMDFPDSGLTLRVVMCCALFICLLSAVFGLVLHHQRKRALLLTGPHHAASGTHPAHLRQRHRLRHRQPLLLSHFVILDPGGYPGRGDPGGYPGRGDPGPSPPSSAPSSPSPFSSGCPTLPAAAANAGSPPSYSEAALDSSYPSWFDLPPPPYVPSPVAEGQTQPQLQRQPQAAPDLPPYVAIQEPPDASSAPRHHGEPAPSLPSETIITPSQRTTITD